MKNMIALWCAAIAVFFVLAPSSAFAQKTTFSSALVIGDYRGGELRREIHRVATLRQNGQPVQITGNVCFSTCTLYLGLPQTCVSPQTVFGFHGPSSYGKPLAPSAFETASQLIVSHYPNTLHDWYLTTARYELRRVFKVTGAHLIRIGAAAPCPDKR